MSIACSQTLPVWRYSGERWRVDRLSPSLALPPAPADTLSLATFNVWFGEHAFDQRAAALCKLLGGLSVDVIGLQEVTPDFLAHLLSQPWLRAQYCVSDVNGSTLDRYGVVLLSRVPVRRFLLLPLPSMMSRRLLVADFGPLAVATVHLESMRPCVEERIVQLDLVCRALAQAPGAVLMGDMNFDKDSREEGTRDASYRDLWAELAPDQPGWTIDNARNTMRHALGKSATPARLDRILLRGDWQGRSIRLLGTEPIAPELHLSDHFGLHATLDRRRST